MKALEVTIHGISPLLMNSNRGVNPLEPLVKQKKILEAKRKRTDDDETEMLHLKFLLAIYHNAKEGVYIPAQNVEAMFRNAAKTMRKGMSAKNTANVKVEPEYIPLKYTGPKTPEELWADTKFSDVRVGKLKSGASITLCRPRFDSWELTFRFLFDESKFDREEVIRLLELAGTDVGLCDYRERYGHFVVQSVKDTK